MRASPRNNDATLCDARAGDVLQISGEARIIWGDQSISGGEGPAKHVEIKVLEAIEAKAANPLRMRMKELSPFGPPVRISARYLATRPAGDAGDAGGNLDSAQKQHLVRCVEILDAAEGIKSFRFEAVQGERLPPWTPGQVGSTSGLLEDFTEQDVE